MDSREWIAIERMLITKEGIEAKTDRQYISEMDEVACTKDVSRMEREWRRGPRGKLGLLPKARLCLERKLALQRWKSFC